MGRLTPGMFFVSIYVWLDPRGSGCKRGGSCAVDHRHYRQRHITGRGTSQAEAHYRQRYIIGRGYLSSGWSKSRTALQKTRTSFFSIL